MRNLRVLGLMLALAGCGGMRHYKNAAEFEAAVLSWQLVGRGKPEVWSALHGKGFACKEALCYREAAGFPCNQRQHLRLVVGESGIVSEINVWKLPDGQLPTVCL